MGECFSLAPSLPLFLVSLRGMLVIRYFGTVSTGGIEHKKKMDLCAVNVSNLSYSPNPFSLLLNVTPTQTF